MFTLTETLLHRCDYHWLPNGQSLYSGDLLTLFRRLDEWFEKAALTYPAERFIVPSFVETRELAKVRYFSNFPQLATFPVALDQSDWDNLTRFTRKNEGAIPDALELTRLDPVRNVLTPSTSYHFYRVYQNTTLNTAQYATAMAPCYRREEHYTPLQRQWQFYMREIVCMGSPEEVTLFLNTFQEGLKLFFQAIGLPIQWKTATDNFFLPSQDTTLVLQLVEPLKWEMLFEETLAIGSTNFHLTTFGEAFQIRRGETHAFSGSVSLGLDRWIYAILSHFGPHPSDWPDFPTLNLP